MEGGDLGPDAAAELRLLRAEIAAIRSGPAPHPAPPERDFRLLGPLRRRLHRRSAVRTGAGHIYGQRHRALVLLVFGIVRIAVWVLLAVLVGLGMLHLGPFGWAKTLAESLPFVALISIYANGATDLDAATAAYAALVAADAHAAAVATGAVLAADFNALQDDISRLAGLQPGPEADELAVSISSKLTA